MDLQKDHSWRDQTEPSAAGPRIVIVGGGFGGLACAAQLGNLPVEVVVLDRRNHNLFQPLLYQVATAALSPADIAEPIRRTLSRFGNIKVLLAEVDAVDTSGKTVSTRCGKRLSYDHLVLSTGSDYNYFGHDEWREFAPGLKTLREARQIRQRLLLAFENAERAQGEGEKRILVSIQWLGRYLTRQRGARIIDEDRSGKPAGENKRMRQANEV